LHNALLHKYKFGHAHCVRLLNRIHRNFTFKFLDISTVFYEFYKFELTFAYLTNSEKHICKSRTVLHRESTRATTHVMQFPATRDRLKSRVGLGLVARSSGENSPWHDAVAHLPAARWRLASSKVLPVSTGGGGGSGERLGMVTGNGAHRKGVVDDEAARWWEARTLNGGEGAPVVAGGARGVLQH
jgi:hypothetical protein